MRVKLEPTASVKPHPSNPRKNHDVDGIARSIRAFGFRQPIAVYDGDGCIVAGHGRLLAARALGLDRVPVHHVGVDEMTAAEAAAYRLADNRSAEGSEWDDALLLAELEALGERERQDAGFEAAFLDELRRRQELEQLSLAEGEDDVPEPPAVPVTRPGDLWVMGEHRLLCGDATSAEDVARLGPHGHLMVTDPPYGVDYDPTWRNRVVRPNGEKVTARSTGMVTNDDRADWGSAWELFLGDVAYVWSGSNGTVLIESGMSLINTGFEIRNQIIWRKHHFAIGRGNYHYQHEPCFYVVRKGRKSHWRGDRTQSTVWDVANACAFGGDVEDGKTSHSTQKPVEVMRRPMLNNSNQGDLVYEPFCGSGSTIIAAETVGRRCHAIEIEPAYVDVSVLRWQKFSGGEAVLDGEGGTFEEVAAARGGAAAA